MQAARFLDEFKLNELKRLTAVVPPPWAVGFLTAVVAGAELSGSAPLRLTYIAASVAPDRQDLGVLFSNLAE